MLTSALPEPSHLDIHVVSSRSGTQGSNRPSYAEAEAAVRILIRWAGDDPGREGLAGTPDRVVRAFTEWFSGYGEDPVALLQRTEETSGYDEMVLLRDIASNHTVNIISRRSSVMRT